MSIRHSDESQKSRLAHEQILELLTRRAEDLARHWIDIERYGLEERLSHLMQESLSSDSRKLIAICKAMDLEATAVLQIPEPFLRRLIDSAQLWHPQAIKEYDTLAGGSLVHRFNDEVPRSEFSKLVAASETRVRTKIELLQLPAPVRRILVHDYERSTDRLKWELINFVSTIVELAQSMDFEAHVTLERLKVLTGTECAPTAIGWSEVCILVSGGETMGPSPLFSSERVVVQPFANRSWTVATVACVFSIASIVLRDRLWIIAPAAWISVILVADWIWGIPSLIDDDETEWPQLDWDGGDGWKPPRPFTLYLRNVVRPTMWEFLKKDADRIRRLALDLHNQESWKVTIHLTVQWQGVLSILAYCGSTKFRLWTSTAFLTGIIAVVRFLLGVRETVPQ